MTQRFSASPTIILRCEPQYYSTYAAFDYRKVRTEFLSEDEFKILQYICRTNATPDEISKAIGIKRGICTKFLERMKRIGYVQIDAAQSGTGTHERAAPDTTQFSNFPLPFLSAPASVDVFITNRCNLDCVHCFSSSSRSSEYDLPARELERLFDQLENLGVLEVRINGGEPLLHPEIAAILATLNGRRFRKVILTNGTLLDDKIIDLLRKSEITPTISLDSHEERYHDNFRRVKGAFRKTLDSMQRLHRSKIEYGVNCCIHKNNLDKWDDIIRLAIEYGASRVAFLDLKLAGRMKSNSSWLPTHSEYQKAMIELAIARVRYQRKIDVALDTFLCCQPPQESVREARKGFVSCQAGRSRLSIDSSGSIYPCNLVLSDPRWYMGNIRNDTISQAWFSEKWLFFRGTRISELRKCGNCKKSARCRDFYCRLASYLASGDPLGPHPKCDS